MTRLCSWLVADDERQRFIIDVPAMADQLSPYADHTPRRVALSALYVLRAEYGTNGVLIIARLNGVQ